MVHQKIKDGYARSHGYNNFEHLICMCYVETLSKHIDEAMKIFANECLKTYYEVHKEKLNK